MCLSTSDARVECRANVLGGYALQTHMGDMWVDGGLRTDDENICSFSTGSAFGPVPFFFPELPRGRGRTASVLL